MIEKRQSIFLIHLRTKLFINSDINKHKKLMLKKSKNDSYVINSITQNVRRCRLNIAPKLNNLYTIENMSP